jgi:hypothetical protein
VIHVEAFLTVGQERYLIRVYDFRQNDAQEVVAQRRSPAAAAGEAALWQTLGGAWAQEPRALRLLRKAVRLDPRDGRSQFYLGALHVYRAGAIPTEFGTTADSGGSEIRAAQQPLDRAAQLLSHDGVPAVFRAFTTYFNGRVDGDDARTALGVAQLEAATTLNDFFNTSVVLFILPRYYPGTSDYYQTRLLTLLDAVRARAPKCPPTYPDVCRSRLVPHAREGASLAFGDVAAKGGRLWEARFWYAIAAAFGSASDYPFQVVAEERLAGAAERVARYQDETPDNDPPIIGDQLPFCTYCHYSRR